MLRIEKTVFISYRRTNMPWALAIYQNLTLHGYDTFFDYDSIPSGDFEQIILGNIKARAHFIVVLTPSALERCENPDDWLRREIETALDERRNIVPVFLEGFDFGSPSIANYLTGKLATLNKYNGQNVPAGFFEEAMDKIRNKFLNIPLDAVLHPLSPMVQKEVEKQQAAASEAETINKKQLTAQEWFEKGFKLDNNKKQLTAQEWFEKGSKLDDNSDEEIQYYTEAIRLKPDYADAYFNRGFVRQREDDLDSAIKDYTEAIRLKPDYADAYNNRGTVCHEKGDLDSAIKDYTEAIRLKPDYADAYNNRGNARKDKTDLHGAIKDYTKAIHLRPDFALAYNNRGLIRHYNGDLFGAIEDYTEAIRLKPDYADAYNNRGNARKDKNHLDSAIKDYTKAIHLRPNFALAYRNRGVTWDKKGDYYSAIADFEKSIQLGDNEPTVPPRIKELKKKIK